MRTAVITLGEAGAPPDLVPKRAPRLPLVPIAVGLTLVVAIVLAVQIGE
jgi:hypothetical protein